MRYSMRGGFGGGGSRGFGRPMSMGMGGGMGGMPDFGGMGRGPGGFGDPPGVGPGGRGLHLGDGTVGSEAVNAASEKLGLMYKWGGKGGPADGGRVDCSGLTHWAYQKLGIEIGSDTYTQITKGVQVSPADIRPGDLIFCEFGEGGTPGPGHVVMATGFGSQSKIIEASHTGAPVAFGVMPRGQIVVKRMVA